MNLKLGEAADALKQLKEERKLVEAQVGELKTKEAELEAYLLARMKEEGVNSIRGGLATVSWYTKKKPIVLNWEEFHAFADRLPAEERWGLLPKSILQAAIIERLEDGQVVPGVGIKEDDFFSVTKV